MAESETKPVATPKKKSSGLVKVKNIRKKSPLCTSKGVIKPGAEGMCTAAEARQLRKFIEIM